LRQRRSCYPDQHTRPEDTPPPSRHCRTPTSTTPHRATQTSRRTRLAPEAADLLEVAPEPPLLEVGRVPRLIGPLLLLAVLLGQLRLDLPLHVVAQRRVSAVGVEPHLPPLGVRRPDAREEQPGGECRIEVAQHFGRHAADDGGAE